MAKGIGGRPKEYENFHKRICSSEATRRKGFKTRLCAKCCREVKHLGMRKKRSSEAQTRAISIALQGHEQDS